MATTKFHTPLSFERNTIVQEFPPGPTSWEIVRKGTFATTFKAKNVGGQILAIKKFNVDVDSSSAFQKEVLGYKKLVNSSFADSHYNLLQMRATYNESNGLYIVFDYHQGGCLEDIFEQKPDFNEQDIRAIMTQLTSALRYCWYEKRIIHKDVRMEHIFVSTWEPIECSLGGFNFSEENSGKSITRGDEFIDGTYQAPEIREPGKSAEHAKKFSSLAGYIGKISSSFKSTRTSIKARSTHKADIYSLGIVLYLLCARQRRLEQPLVLPESPVSPHKWNAMGSMKNLARLSNQKWMKSRRMTKRTSKTTPPTVDELKLAPEETWKGVTQNAKNLVRQMLQKDPRSRLGYNAILAHPFMRDKSAQNASPISEQRIEKLVADLEGVAVSI